MSVYSLFMSERMIEFLQGYAPKIRSILKNSKIISEVDLKKLDSSEILRKMWFKKSEILGLIAENFDFGKTRLADAEKNRTIEKLYYECYPRNSNCS